MQSPFQRVVAFLSEQKCGKPEDPDHGVTAETATHQASEGDLKSVAVEPIYNSPNLRLQSSGDTW